MIWSGSNISIRQILGIFLISITLFCLLLILLTQFSTNMGEIGNIIGGIMVPFIAIAAVMAECCSFFIQNLVITYKITNFAP